MREGAWAAGAVEPPDVSMLLYPAYFCLVNAATALLIHRRRAILRAADLLAAHPPKHPPVHSM